MTEAIFPINVKFTFSGHDTFHCRQLWLKKGYDFVQAKNKFTKEDAVVELGVGKNMVSAIHFWMKAFGLLDKEGNTTDLADYIFGEKGKDPYLEDNATLWLLHYHLITQGLASTYNLIFNQLRKEKIEFTKDNFLFFVERKAAEAGLPAVNRKTAASDFEVFLKMYNRTSEQEKDKEDSFAGLLTHLDLLQEERRKPEDKISILNFSIPNKNRTDIPEDIILYAILNNGGFQNSINFETIYQDKNQPGLVFAIEKSALLEKLEAIAANPWYARYRIRLSDHAGIKELQFATQPDKFEVLNNYYGQ